MDTSVEAERGDQLGDCGRDESVDRLAAGHADPGTSRDALRILPREEVAELVRADQEQRIAPAPGLEHVDRALVWIELDFTVREGGLREPQACVAVELDLLVSRTDGDEDDDFLEVEPLFGGLRQGEVSVVRRVERAAEEACHWTSSMSPPSTSTSSPVRAPAAFSAAASSSSSVGTSPAMRKPRSVRRMRKRRPPGLGR